MLSNNSLQDSRRRQIDTLKVFNNNVTGVKANEEYSVGFSSDKRKMLLNVFLGPNFPNDKPKIVITPQIQHEWIPEPATGEIQTAPGLLSFNVHSDLGRVVHAIIREYEKFPPPLWASTNATPTVQPPMVPQNVNVSCIPELCNLSINELMKLDQDPQYLNDFVGEMAVIQRIERELDTLIDDVKTNAHENLSREQHVSELKTNIEAKLDEFRALSNSYDSLSTRYQRKAEEFAPQHIKELLQIAALNADSTCDTYVEQFLNGTMEVQQLRQTHLFKNTFRFRMRKLANSHSPF